MSKKQWVAGVCASMTCLGWSVLAMGYEAGEVKDGGTIKGTVLWAGGKPNITPLPVVKDKEICDPEKTGLKPSPRLILTGNGVKNTVVYIEKIDKGKPIPAAWSKISLDQKTCVYDPHVQVAAKKAKITLRSSDDILHNIHMYGAEGYNLPFPDKNTIEKKLRREGLISIVCDAGHSWMSAYIHVVTHPYYAISDGSGAFTLDQIPPGKYVLKAWHEGWTVTETIKKDGEIARYEYSKPVELSQEVTVTAGGTAEVKFELK